jgi:hypothetical protein
VRTPRARVGAYPGGLLRGGGYDLVDPPARTAFAHPALEQPAEFWTARFRKSASPTHEDLRIYWAWNAQGAWEAPGSPRLKFARFPVLYKLYVIAEEPATAEPALRKARQGFFDRLLPALQDALSRRFQRAPREPHRGMRSVCG